MDYQITKLHSFQETSGKEVAWIEMHEHEVTSQTEGAKPTKILKQELFLRVKGTYSVSSEYFHNVGQAKRWFKRVYFYTKEEGRWHKLKN